MPTRLGCKSVIEQIIQDSEECINWILSLEQVDSIKDLLSFAHSVSYKYEVPIFPYFAGNKFSFTSLFAENWIKRLMRQNLLSPSSFKLTNRGKKVVRTKNPIGITPATSFSNAILPYSNLPPSNIRLPSKTVMIRPQIDEFGLIMIGLLPLDPRFYFVFSHFDKDGMRTTYPLIKENDAYLTLCTGDIRNVVAVPETRILESCYKGYGEYLGKYARGYKKCIEIVVYLLLSMSTIQFTHTCNSQTLLLNKEQNRIHKMLDFVPNCPGCGMKADLQSNVIEMRHSLGHSWEKGILSELYFSKLVVDVAHRIDPSIEVYPRLRLEGVPHECDVFVKRGSDIILFELKRSTVYDRWCQKGEKQLRENIEILEGFGAKCTSVLVTNLINRNLPKETEIDMHLTPDDFVNLYTMFQSLLS